MYILAPVIVEELACRQQGKTSIIFSQGIDCYTYVRTLVHNKSLTRINFHGELARPFVKFLKSCV